MLGGFGFGDGEKDANGGALRAGIDLHVTVELEDALLHAAQPNAGAPGVEIGEFFLGDAVAIVLNFEGDLGGIAINTDASGLAAGVPVNIGEGFLDNAEDDQLHIGSKPSEVIRNGEIDFEEAAIHEAHDVPAKSAGEAAFFEQRRMEQVRSGPNLLAQLTDEVGSLLQGGGGN